MAAVLSSVNARGNVACFTAKQSAQAPRRGQLQVRGPAWAAGPAPHFAPATCRAGPAHRSFGGVRPTLLIFLSRRIGSRTAFAQG